MDAEQALDAAFHLGSDGCLFQLVAQSLLNPRQELLALLAASLNCVVYLLVGKGIEITESKVLEFAANLAHSEAVGDGSINLKCFLGDLLLAFWRKMLEGPHVV